MGDNMRAWWLAVGVVGLSSACTVQVWLWPQDGGPGNTGGDSSSSAGLGGAGGMASSLSSSSSSSGGGGMGNPFWENLPNDMNEARLEHTMTKLADGRVLITGGFASTAGASALASAEIWNPTTLEFTPVATMNTPRARHTATLLANGNVVVTGGYDGTLETDSIEVYNPNTNVWTQLSEKMSAKRMYHAALVLPNDSLLTASGCCDAAYKTAETTAVASIMPTPPHTVTATDPIIAHAAPTLTLLPGERALLVGNAQFKTTEWYDAGSDTWNFAGNLNVARNSHTANLRASGHVVVAGGATLVNNTAKATETVEDFDPATNQWTLLDPMKQARWDHSGTLLTMQGQEDIVWAGGRSTNGTVFATCERASPGKTCGDLNVPRTLHRALVVSVNGQERVMVTGGLEASGQVTKSAEWLRW